MIPLLKEVLPTADDSTCIEICGVEVEDVELVHVDFATNIATVKRRGIISRGPMMVRTDHPDYMGREIAVLFV